MDSSPQQLIADLLHEVDDLMRRAHALGLPRTAHKLNKAHKAGLDELEESQPPDIRAIIIIGPVSEQR